jgi:hypothetical protein
MKKLIITLLTLLPLCAAHLQAGWLYDWMPIHDRQGKVLFYEREYDFGYHPQRVESKVEVRNATKHPLRVATYFENVTTGQKYFMGHIVLPANGDVMTNRVTQHGRFSKPQQWRWCYDWK